MDLIKTLETLVSTIEQKGYPMRSRLNAGLTRDEIDVIVKPLNIVPPEAFYQLYEWHNGIVDVYDSRESLFGDYQFLPLEEAVQEYHAIMQYFSYHSPFIDTAQCFPFASFQAQYCTVYCENRLIDGLINPVIEIYDAYSIVFEDIEHAAQTANAWFASGIYDQQPVDESQRLSIRQQLNARILPRTTSL